MSQLGHGSIGGTPIGGTGTLPDIPDPPELVSDSLTLSDQIAGIPLLKALALDIMSMGFVSEESKVVALDLFSTLGLSDEIDPRTIAVLIDQMNASGSFSYSWEGMSALADEVGMNDLLAIFLSDALEESITIGDIWSHYGLVLALADALRITGTTTSIVETRDLLADTFLVRDLIDRFMAGELVDSATIADSYQLALKAINAVLDGMIVDDDSAFSLTATALVEEQATLADETDTIGELISALTDGLVAAVYLTTDTGVYDAWAMNTITSGVTRYENQPFNSFALHSNQKYVGATEDGVFELDGPDDDGTSIDAWLKTGLMDFGSTLNKRVRDVWVGMATDGQLLLKMTTTDGVGQAKVERWYRVSETPNMYRASLAKGVKAKYWQFQLENVDGADFDIDQITMHVIPLSRRH